MEVDINAVIRAIDHAIEHGSTVRKYIDILRDEYGIIGSPVLPGGFKIIDEQKYMLFLLKWA